MKTFVQTIESTFLVQDKKIKSCEKCDDEYSQIHKF